MTTRPSASRKTRKIAALAAGVLVVGVGASYTLASWNDSEWVWGGADGEAIATEVFDVEQFTEGTWHDDETNPGGALNFTAAALSLTPGDTVYAPVSLRTKENSIGGTVTLQEADKADGVPAADADDSLWDAVDLAVYTSDEAITPACVAGDFDAADWTPVAGVSSLDTAATASQTLGAATADAPGAPQHYCFVLSLPENPELPAGETDVRVLQGRTIAPAWEFAAVSG